jgi:hypothetical protein
VSNAVASPSDGFGTLRSLMESWDKLGEGDQGEMMLADLLVRLSPLLLSFRSGLGLFFGGSSLRRKRRVAFLFAGQAEQERRVEPACDQSGDLEATPACLSE